MAERRRAAGPDTGSTVAGADWSGRDLSGSAHEHVLFTDLDLTESESHGAVFTECTFRRVKFNCSAHAEAAFVNCTFVNCNFFEVSFTDCKLVGSTFERCTFDLMAVSGGNWSHVGLAGADLRRATLRDVRLREADLTGVCAEDGELRDCDLSGASLDGAKLTGCDLRGSDLGALAPDRVDLRGAVITVEQAVTIAQALGLDVRAE